MRENKRPLITVMIPIYNTEKYLERCLNSIINQTYTKLEIILVNDGSTDGSLEICEKFQNKDNRIKLIDKKNEGASQARNTALEYATGDYYGFVDSDDWIMPGYFETLLKNSIQTNADISRCQSFTAYNESVDKKAELKTLTHDEFMPLVLNDKISSHLWKNIFRKELFEGISFPDNYSAHDMMVFHKVLNKANLLTETNEKLYYYFEDRPDNMSNNPSGLFKGTIGRAMAFYERYYIAKNEFPEVEKIILKKAVRFSIASFARAERYPNDDFNKELLILESFLDEEHKAINQSNYVNLSEKIAVKLIRANSKAFMSIFKYI